MRKDEAISRLRAARVGRLATVRPDGTPHVVPFVFALVEDGDDLRAYWAVDEKPKKRGPIQRIENIEANAAVEFVVDRYDEDWATLWWVRVAGRARIAAGEERERALEALAEKYPAYAAERPPGPVVAIDVDRITAWASTEV